VKEKKSEAMPGPIEKRGKKSREGGKRGGAGDVFATSPPLRGEKKTEGRLAEGPAYHRDPEGKGRGKKISRKRKGKSVLETEPLQTPAGGHKKERRRGWFRRHRRRQEGLYCK